MKELLTFILICLGVFGLIFFLAWTFSQVEISVDEYRLLHNQMKQFPELQVEIKKAFEDGRITSYEFEIIEDQYNQCMKKQALYNDRLRSIRRQNKQVISYYRRHLPFSPNAPYIHCNGNNCCMDAWRIFLLFLLANTL